jgi:hypothetical protein
VSRRAQGQHLQIRGGASARSTFTGTKIAALGRMLLKTKQILSGQLLHLAGQSLGETSGRLLDDRFVPYFLIVFAFSIVCFVEWTQKIAGIRPDPRFWMVMSILVTIYGGCRAFRLFPQLRMRRTEHGKRRVAEILDRIRSKGFVVFNNSPDNDFHFDHVVVGPCGIYALETKARSGSGTIEYRSDGELLLGGRINDGRAVSQTRAAAHSLHLYLRELLHKGYWVNPMLVFEGSWRVQRARSDFSIDVMTADELEEYFDRQPAELDSEEIAHICSQLEHVASA